MALRGGAEGGWGLIECIIKSAKPSTVGRCPNMGSPLLMRQRCDKQTRGTLGCTNARPTRLCIVVFTINFFFILMENNSGVTVLSEKGQALR